MNFPILQPNLSFFTPLIQKFWFAPQDVLLRATEANIMHAITPKKPILDIGIGDGQTSVDLYPKNLKIDVGIDPNSAGFDEAKKTGIYKIVLAADAANMPFKKGTFSSVISNSTFEHIAEDKQAVLEVGRVLKKGGRFYLTVPSIFLPDLILRIEQDGGATLEEAQKRLQQLNTRVHHIHYHSLKEWTAFCTKGKMKVVHSQYYFSEAIVRVWYKQMKFAIHKIFGREMWSWLADSSVSKFIPQSIAVWIRTKETQGAYQQAFNIENNVGGMLFLIAEKQ